VVTSVLPVSGPGENTRFITLSGVPIPVPEAPRSNWARKNFSHVRPSCHEATILVPPVLGVGCMNPDGVALTIGTWTICELGVPEFWIVIAVGVAVQFDVALLS